MSFPNSRPVESDIPIPRNSYANEMDQARLLELISTRQRELKRPTVVGISGYCGSGKSTLARSIVAALPGAVRMRGDDFLDPARSHERSSDWDGVDRQRLVSSVLVPLRMGQTGQFRRYNWSTQLLGVSEPLPQADVLVVDLIGLFHPDALPFIDIPIWCDVDLETAARRGMARDVALGRRHEALWRDIWIPNEVDFEERFAPKETAIAFSQPSQ